VFEAIRMCEERGDNRPTVRVAKWYYRLSLAEPRPLPHVGLAWARELAAAEASGPDALAEVGRLMEYRLVHPGKQPDAHILRGVTLEAAEGEGLVSTSTATVIRAMQQGGSADER
jgi:hypothetical protein